jgi:hypothetical protein
MPEDGAHIRAVLGRTHATISTRRGAEATRLPRARARVREADASMRREEGTTLTTKRWLRFVRPVFRIQRAWPRYLNRVRGCFLRFEPDWKAGRVTDEEVVLRTRLVSCSFLPPEGDECDARTHGAKANREEPNATRTRSPRVDRDPEHHRPLWQSARFLAERADLLDGISQDSW